MQDDTKIEVMWKNDISAIASVQDNKVNVQYFTNDPLRCLFPKKPMRNDYIWLRFDDEPLEYNDVKIREG